MFIKKRFKIFLIPDGGGDGGSPGDNSTPPNPQEATRPKYLDQISPDKRDSDDYKTLYKYQTLTDLTDATIATNKELTELKEKTSRMIEIPDGKDEAKLKEFKTALGIPENPSDYKIKHFDNGGIPESLNKEIKDIAHRALFSQSQAEAVGMIVNQIVVSQAKEIKEKAKNIKDNFKTNLAASYTEYTQDIDKTSAADKDANEFNAFLRESGLDTYFSDEAPLRYEPAFVKAIAKYARAHNGSSNTTPSLPPGAIRKPAMQYGKDFSDKYTRR